MAAITTMIAAGSLALGAASAAVQYNQQKGAQKKAQRRADQQKTEAIEAAKLKGIETSEARVQVGATDANENAVTATADKGKSKRKRKSDAMGRALAPSASRIGGL